MYGELASLLSFPEGRVSPRGEVSRGLHLPLPPSLLACVPAIPRPRPLLSTGLSRWGGPRGNGSGDSLPGPGVGGRLCLSPVVRNECLSQGLPWPPGSERGRRVRPTSVPCPSFLCPEVLGAWGPIESCSLRRPLHIPIFSCHPSSQACGGTGAAMTNLGYLGPEPHPCLLSPIVTLPAGQLA